MEVALAHSYIQLISAISLKPRNRALSSLQKTISSCSSTCFLTLTGLRYALMNFKTTVEAEISSSVF
jgi:sulfur transfer protein SufE